MKNDRQNQIFFFFGLQELLILYLFISHFKFSVIKTPFVSKVDTVSIYTRELHVQIFIGPIEIMLVNLPADLKIWQKFGKFSSDHRTGKGQFSFQSQRKAMPKNAQTTAQLHSSHMLVK